MPRLKRNNHTIQQLEQASVHDWYRFVLAYPDHLVADVIERFGATSHHTILDPFVGTGTTLVECKKRGINSIGIDANPMMAFASRVKTNWNIDLAEFDRRRAFVLESVRETLSSHGDKYPIQYSFADIALPEHIARETGSDYTTLIDLLPKNWVSNVPLRKVLVLRDTINKLPPDDLTDLFRLAMATVIVADASNLGFGPEVYVAKNRTDADVYGAFSERSRRMRNDLETVQQVDLPGQTTVHCGDARQLSKFIQSPVDFVITSPPYPNEKDYTRTTRLELILLGFMRAKSDLRQVKETMLRSHTRNIFVDDDDSKHVVDIPEIQQVASEIEKVRKIRGATSGFEKLYHRVVTEYFGGMYRLLEQLQQVMPAHSKLALVVGDQMSYFRVPIRTARLISIVASRKLRYREVETLLWRTRRATATRVDVEEHILMLERC